MHAWFRCAAPAAAMLLATSVASRSQQPTFRSGVDVVTVDVSASRGGEHIDGLREGSFEVFDNGAQQKIDRVTLEQVPLEAYLLFDVSGSIAGAKLQQLQNAANAFANGLTPQDKVALITFAQKVDVRQSLTGDFEAFQRAVSEITAGGQTALYDATLHTIGLRHHNDNRAVLVVLTDEGDNASETSQKQVIEAAERSDVIAYGVLAAEQGAGVGGGMGRGMGFRPPQVQFQIGFLRSLAEATGGRVFRTTSRLRLDDAFALVLDDARARYVLTFRPTNPAPGWHKLHVRLVGAKGDVVARRGYFVGGESK
jgi:VWFA-related protein